MILERMETHKECGFLSDIKFRETQKSLFGIHFSVLSVSNQRLEFRPANTGGICRERYQEERAVQKRNSRNLQGSLESFAK